MKFPQFLEGKRIGWTWQFDFTGGEPMEFLKTKIVKFLLQKYVLGYMVKGYEKLTGYKTQICAAAWCIVLGAKLMNYIEPQLADQVLHQLEAAFTISALQKLKRY